MSEFNFLCPACGQSVLCDTTHAGTEIACPVCNAAIMVPTETAGPADASPPTDVPPAWTGHNATAAQRTSRLAVASLVCSLASLITCVGWLPGIICGHLAKSRIRRDSSLKGSGLATAGLVLGYLFLVLEAGTAAVQIWRVSTAMKRGYENVRQNLATNNIIVTQTQFTAVSNDHRPMEPVKLAAVVTNNPQSESIQSGWTSDIRQASFPDHPASGKIHGMDFAVRSASFRNGTLKISSADRMSVDVYRLGDSIAGRSYEIQSADDSTDHPHVKMTWNGDGVIQTATFSKGYGLKLQFGQAKGRKLSAKIYLCLPDDSKSCVAGTFEMRLLRPRGGAGN
jgi:DNA-directed RNA polymerase subunit RPC12/RpoP